MRKTGSPLLREILEEETTKAARKATRDASEKALTTFLKARFGPEARSLRSGLKAIDDDRLGEFLELAATCPDLASFREQLPPPRRKRKS